jgi:hypothetical protein
VAARTRATLSLGHITCRPRSVRQQNIKAPPFQLHPHPEICCRRMRRRCYLCGCSGITTTTAGAKEEFRPAPNEPVEASENAPNEPNPDGPEPARNDLAKFDAWNREEERGQQPESGITRGELKATQTKNEPMQAERGYREYQIAETVLVHLHDDGISRKQVEQFSRFCRVGTAHQSPAGGRCPPYAFGLPQKLICQVIASRLLCGRCVTDDSVD